MGRLELVSGHTVITYKWGHVVLMGNLRAGVSACQSTPHPHRSCAEQERACQMPGEVPGLLGHLASQ